MTTNIYTVPKGYKHHLLQEIQSLFTQLSCSETNTLQTQPSMTTGIRIQNNEIEGVKFYLLKLGAASTNGTMLFQHNPKSNSKSFFSVIIITIA